MQVVQAPEVGQPDGGAVRAEDPAGPGVRAQLDHGPGGRRRGQPGPGELAQEFQRAVRLVPGSRRRRTGPARR